MGCDAGNARKHPKEKADWGASFSCHIAAYRLRPETFSVSRNLERLRSETRELHPNLPAANVAIMVEALGPLDLEAHDAPMTYLARMYLVAHRFIFGRVVS